MKTSAGRNSPTPPSSGRISPKMGLSSTSSSAASPRKVSSKAALAASKTTGVMDYLIKSTSRTELLSLYEDPGRGRFVCRAVLQRLPGPAQQIVIRLSCTGGSFTLAMISSWIKASSNKVLMKWLDLLNQWAIIVENPNHSTNSKIDDYDDDNNKNNNNNSNHNPSIELTTEFMKGLKDSLHSLDSSPWNALTLEQIQHITEEAIRTTGKTGLQFPTMTPEDLERYTQAQWDSVLHYLVGTGSYEAPNPAVIHFLLQTDLMQPDPEFKGREDDAPLVITTKGYDFMLQDNSQQVWHFIVQYMASMEETMAATPEKAKALKREALLVLICLSFARFGECYIAPKEGRTIIRDFALFGLLYVKKLGKTHVFYPTRIAMQLVGTEGSSKGSGNGIWSWSSKALESALAHPRPHDSSHLAIIVQTNFQLCAYTTSELHVSMLGLFCDVQTIRRLPNVVFMSISRDSIKGAFNLGIQAQQILRFLEKHVHPKLRESGTDPLPGNVVDQIYLWDRERHRVRWSEVFVHEPMMPGEFHAVQTYSMDHACHSWSSEARNKIMINYSHVERVQNFIQKWRAKKAAGRL